MSPGVYRQWLPLAGSGPGPPVDYCEDSFDHLKNPLFPTAIREILILILILMLMLMRILKPILILVPIQY